MNTSRKDIKPYILAGISMALIACFFIPFYWVPDKEIYDVYNEFYQTEDYPIAYYCISFAEMIWSPFITLLYINCANIFIQAHGSNKTFSIISAVAGLIGIIECHTYNARLNHGHYHINAGGTAVPGYEEGNYSITFYLIISLLLAQLILPLIFGIIEKARK